MTKLIMALMICWFAMTAVPGVAATTEQVQTIIGEATTTRKIAGALGYEWTTTKDLTEQAQKALAADRVDEAETLARQALKQAQNSVAQAKYAESHWQEMIPR